MVSLSAADEEVGLKRLVRATGRRGENEERESEKVSRLSLRPPFEDKKEAARPTHIVVLFGELIPCERNQMELILPANKSSMGRHVVALFFEFFAI